MNRRLSRQERRVADAQRRVLQTQQVVRAAAVHRRRTLKREARLEAAATAARSAATEAFLDEQMARDNLAHDPSSRDARREVDRAIDDHEAATVRSRRAERAFRPGGVRISTQADSALREAERDLAHAQEDSARNEQRLERLQRRLTR
jgi:hypothetical protein